MPELTAEIIANLQTPSELSLSPDGRSIAYALVPNSKKEEHRVSALWLAPTDGSEPPRAFTAGVAEDRQPQWSPVGTQLAFLSDRAKRGTAQLYWIATNGGEARALTPTTNKRPVLSFAWSPDGAHIAFTSADEPTDEDERREKERDDADVFGERWQHARLRLLTLATGEIQTLASGEQHIAEFVWAPDGQSIAYLVWQAPPLEFAQRGVVCAVLDLQTRKQRTVCAIERRVRSLRWSGDGQQLLLISAMSINAQSSGGLWAVSAQGGELCHLALGQESCAMDIAQPPTAHHALATIATGLDTRLGWCDVNSGAITWLPDETPGDLVGAIAQKTPDGRLIFAAARAQADRPWNVWIGRGQSDSVEWRALSNHHTALAEVRFGPQEPFFWRSVDGWAMDGILIRPPDAPQKPLPTVVLVHGGPYGRWGQGCNLSWGNWAQWLALAGYAVLMPNPRGGFGHGERFAAAARADVGGMDYHDVMSAADAAIARGIADPQRMGIGGWSQGGFMTAWAVTQTQRFKAGVMGAGVSDWGMMVATSDVPDFERTLGGTAPWDGLNANRHAQLSPLYFARQVKTPVLILHGEKDARVPLSQAIGFHRALREFNVPTELVVYPREPHGIGEYAHQLDVLKRVRAWFARWL